MSDTPSWNNGRLGPYQLGRRHWDLGSHLGRLHEARNVETGAFCVLLTPMREAAWPRRTAWTARITSEMSPRSLALELEPAPGAEAPPLHELTLTFDQLTGVLGNIPSEDRADVLAHLIQKPRGSGPGQRLARASWPLAGAAVAVAAGLALLVLWPRAPKFPETQQAPEMPEVAEEPVAFINMQEPPFPFVGYPMPEKPFKEQEKPPCLKGTSVEIRGGCWVQLKADAPCPKSTAEFEGKCYMPVRKKDPPPSSLQP